MIAALLLAGAAAAAAAPADRQLACRMTTPAGDAIAFSARLGSPTAVLEPAAGTAWPARRVIGVGGWREKKRFDAAYHFAGKPTGIDLWVEGERATLLVGKKLRSGAPRAYGFCLPQAGGAAAGGDVPVATDAAAAVPAFDSARWSADRCALVTRTGRQAWIGYSLADRGARVEISSAEADIVPGAHVVLPMQRAVAPQPSRFGGDGGPRGIEWFVLDQKTGEGVKLIDFDAIGTAAEPAAAICGYSNIIGKASWK